MTAMRTLSSRRLGSALTALLSLAAVGCATTLAPAPPIVYEEYRVGAPDEIQLTILPDPAIEDSMTVRPDGKITVQLIGDVQAGGRTPGEIAREIEERVKRFKRGAQATVSITSAASSTITVLGEVGSPGTFSLSKQTRVAEALGTSRGTTPFANLDAITVIRGSQTAQTQVLRVDLAAIRGGDLSTNVLVYGGDIIYVPPTAWARVGYTIQAILFPLQPLLGLATSVGGSAIGGGF